MASGLLDIPGFNPADFQVSEEERRKLLLGNLLLGLGAGALNANKGNWIGAAGSGAVQGMMLGQNALSQAQAAKLDQLKAASGFMDVAQKKQALQDDQAYRTAMSQYMPPWALPEGAAGPPADPSMTDTNPYKRALAEVAYLKNKGVAPQYIAAAEARAEKFRPKIKEQKTLTQNGKRVTVNVYEDGTYQVLPDVSPDLEPAHFGSTGGMTNIPIDKFTGQPLGPGLPATMDPAQIASNKIAQGHLAIAQNADRRAAENQGKPQWDSASGMFVIPPSAANPTGAAIMPSGFEKPDKPLTESQAKATAFANQMANASQTIAALEAKGFTGATKGQQAAIVSAGTEGIPYVPGTAAIPRMAAGKDAQIYQQAELQWTEGALRFMTGANAPKEEVIRNAATYFPRPGDSDALIARKKAARENMEQSIRMAAGAGTRQLGPISNGGGWSVTEVK